MINNEIINIWPINDIINDLNLKLELKQFPAAGSQSNPEIFSAARTEKKDYVPLFSINYSFEKITLLTCFLLNKNPYHNTNLYQNFINIISSTEYFPISELESITGNKSIFDGKTGFVELLFRGKIKKQKRKKGKWYNTDFNINCENVKNLFSNNVSNTYRIFGFSKSKFELYYYKEIGFPFNFELEMLNRLIITKEGSYFAVIIPNDKRQRIRLETIDLNFVKNDEYRVIAKNQRVINSVLEICKNYRLEKNKLITKEKKKTPEKCLPHITNSLMVPKNSTSIPLSIRKQVWRVYNGNVGSAACFVCNNNITALDYECGHIQAKSKGGENTIDNLLPICGSCNKSMSDMHLFEYVEKHFQNLQSKCFCLPAYIDWENEKKFHFF